MSDAVSRDAVMQLLQEWTYCCDVEDLVRALPAVQPDAREAALREAAALAETVSEKWREEDGMAKDTCSRVSAAILALIGESHE